MAERYKNKSTTIAVEGREKRNGNKTKQNHDSSSKKKLGLNRKYAVKNLQNLISLKFFSLNKKEIIFFTLVNFAMRKKNSHKLTYNL